MKTLLFSLIFLISFISSQAQIVSIPDENFKNALVYLGVDTNDDGQIQVVEAEAQVGLIDLAYSEGDVPGFGITDLTGIEAFVNITELDCSNNLIGSLDVSSNINLTKLTCFDCELTSINITNNTNLEELYCSQNLLTTINVSTNVNLETLNCSSNQIETIDFAANSTLNTLWCSHNTISSLDLSTFTNLTSLSCNFNSLSFLDLRNGNNTAILSFNSTHNIYLTCVFVDDVLYSEDNWNYVDATSHFVEDEETCEIYIDVASEQINAKATLYPNPTPGEFIFETPTIATKSNTKIWITNSLGEVVLLKNIESTQTLIDLSEQSIGVYYLFEQHGEDSSFMKILIE